MNSVASQRKKFALGVARGGVQGRKRKFNVISEDKIAKMVKINYQQ